LLGPRYDPVVSMLVDPAATVLLALLLSGAGEGRFAR
jgi:hypothetical protein